MSIPRPSHWANTGLPYQNTHQTALCLLALLSLSLFTKWFPIQCVQSNAYVSFVYKNIFKIPTLNQLPMWKLWRFSVIIIIKKSRFLLFLGRRPKFHPPELYWFFWSQVMGASLYKEELFLKAQTLYDLTACPHLGTRLGNLLHKPCVPIKHEWHLMFLYLRKLNSFMLFSLLGHNECNRVLFSQQLTDQATRQGLNHDYMKPTRVTVPRAL